jgi:asparagine synthase (glutamine-hydrolysing)
MCGITAICSNDTPVSRTPLVCATETLRHRGPDERRYWIDPHGRVGLGHARLSIIDLATGQQPMTNEDGTLHAVVNGEFYGYRELQRELRARGHRLHSQSDSEVLLHLYEEEGAACLRHLRGEFAFVLWDARQRRLLAARDRFGIKPLFYAHVGSTLFLASEVKALFAAGVPAGWDDESCYQALLLFPQRDRSLFRDVRQVPPGHCLHYASDTLRLEAYWRLDYPIAPAADSVPDDERIERVRVLLQESTRLRLDADVPVSCLLSGGVDSGALLGIASAETGGAPRAFTGIFPMLDSDEVDAACGAADHAGAPLELMRVSDQEMADHLPDAVWHAETLGINLHGVARYLLCRHVHRADLRVALTGEGADELFGGYVHLRQDATAPLSRDEEVPEALRAFRDRLGFVPAWLHAIAVRQSLFHALLAPEYAARFDGLDVFGALLDDVGDVGGEAQLRGRTPLQQSMHLWTATILPSYILFAERLEMAHAVEVRLPYLDHVLFDHVRTLPADLLFRDGREKYALREAVRPFIADATRTRAKQPFLAPMTTADIGSPLRDLVRDELRSASMASLPFFDHDAVLALDEALPNMPPQVRASLDAALLKIVCASVLQRRYRPATH